MWLHALFNELGFPIKAPPLLLCDNLRATHLSFNPVQHSSIKHIQINLYFVRDLVQRGNLHVRQSTCSHSRLTCRFIDQALVKATHINLTSPDWSCRWNPNLGGGGVWRKIAQIKAKISSLQSCCIMLSIICNHCILKFICNCCIFKSRLQSCCHYKCCLFTKIVLQCYVYNSDYRSMKCVGKSFIETVQCNSLIHRTCVNFLRVLMWTSVNF